MNPNVLTGDRQAFFGCSQKDKRARDLCSQRYQNIIVIRDGCLQVGDAGLYCPAEFAPNIQFPGRIQSDIENGKVSVGSSDIRRIFAGLVDACRAKAKLRLGVLKAKGNSQLRPGFVDPQTGNLQRQVLLIGGFYQVIENRVMEHRPPVSHVGILGFDFRFIRLQPFIRLWRLGLDVVRANHGAAADHKHYDEQSKYCRRNGYGPNSTKTRRR